MYKDGFFHIPVDFGILNYKVDFDFPIILGKPFLARVRALVDKEMGKIKFRIMINMSL